MSMQGMYILLVKGKRTLKNTVKVVTGAATTNGAKGEYPRKKPTHMGAPPGLRFRLPGGCGCGPRDDWFVECLQAGTGKQKTNDSRRCKDFHGRHPLEYPQDLLGGSPVGCL